MKQSRRFVAGQQECGRRSLARTKATRQGGQKEAGGVDIKWKNEWRND